MQLSEEKKKQTFIMAAIAYAALLLITLHIVQVRIVNPDMEILDLLMESLSHFASKPFDLGQTIRHPIFLIKGIAVVSVVFLMGFLYFYSELQGKVHEDAKTAKGGANFNRDYKGFKERYTLPKAGPNAPDKNLILAKDVKYGLKQGSNTNVAIMGSAGSGKSFGVIKPNLMQMNSSYVVTDPSGEIFRSEAVMLMENGYDVKVFSTSSMLHSNCYNPFDYVYDEDGEVDETRVSSMINMFLQNAGNMEEAKKASGDKFWDQAAKALLGACAMLLLEYYPPEKQNMYEMLRLVQKGKQNENDKTGNGSTELNELFERARKINPEAHCFSSYDTFNLAPARTANSILISAAVDLNMFNQDKVRNMTTTAYKVKVRNVDGTIRSFSRDEKGQLIRTDDNLDLRTVGDKKTCIFINIPQADATYNFLVSMMYSQLFEALYGRAEKICPKKYLIVNSYGDALVSMINSEDDALKLVHYYQNATLQTVTERQHDMCYIVNPDAERRFQIPGTKGGKLQKFYSQKAAENYLAQFKDCQVKHGKEYLPWHVQCLLDEFSNIGSIPAFPQKLATMRKYEISCMIVVQSKSQLEARYDKLYSDILSNCDSTIFLGSSDPDTCKYVSDRLGKKTIRVKNVSRSSSGKGGSYSESYNLDSRELMTPDEVSRLSKKECIVFVSGEQPFKAKKYRALDHPNWKYTGDVDKNARLESTDFILCKEKKFSKFGDAQRDSNILKGSLEGKDVNGQKVTDTPIKIHTPEEMVKAAGIKAPTTEEAIKKIIPTPEEQNLASDLDVEDWTPKVPNNFSAKKRQGDGKASSVVKKREPVKKQAKQ